MIIKLLIDGGDMKPGPAIAQKIGPLGINMGQVIQQVNDQTNGFKGMKVPVTLDVNPKTKNFSISVSSPPIAELLKKEIGVEKASGEHKKLKAGNLSIEQIIKIAKTKLPNMLSKDLKSAVKTVIGSCQSLGILIENREAKDVEKEIQSGKYNTEIEEEKTKTTPEKLGMLKKYFDQLHKKQEVAIKKEEEEAAAAEEAKKAAAPAEGEAIEGESPAEGEVSEGEEETPSTETKEE